MNLPRRGFDHRTNNDEGDKNDFIDFFEIAATSPNVDTVGMLVQVSASCYRTVLAAVLVALW